MIKKYIDKCKKNRMHVICFAITVVSLVMGLFFPNAITRLLESIRDLLTSFAYYLVYLVTDSNNPVPPTILQPQGWFIASEVWEPVQLFPSSIAEFLSFWGNYFGLVFNFEYFRAYLNLIGDCLVYIVKLLMPLMFFVVYLILKVYFIKTTHCTERNKKSKQLIAFENKWFEVTGKIKNALNSFIAFLSENTYYVIIWLAVWLLYFNAFSIVISFVAYYLYFIASFNVFSLYGQILKLQTDLTPVIRFIPGIVWAIIIFAVYDAWCKSIAEERIRYAFRCNKAFLRQRGISSVLFGKMGTMKTLTQVEMAVTLQDMKFGDAYETMIEFEHRFINFPWQNLRDELKFRIDKRMIVDTISCRKQISKWSKVYDLIRKKYTFDEYQKYVEKKDIGFTDFTFKYDYSHYKSIYTNGVKLTTLYQAIEEYACAYYLFTVQTSLLFSNISIRSDSVLDDMGNMPFRYNYLLSKDPFERMKNSQYSHIIDIDMIRRGKQVVKDNPKARTILPAIFVLDEMDKEWKNMNELKDVKSNVDEANQKNDGHNIGYSVSRHSNLVNYKSYVSYLGTLQRIDSLGAGTRQLGEMIVIESPGEQTPVLPFFSPFWLFESIFLVINAAWMDFYKTKIQYRCDEILSVYIVKNIMAALSNHYDKINNLYGVRIDKVVIEDGLREGEATTDYWRHITRIAFSDVYVSDCYRGIFDPDVPNTMHIDDYECYKGIVATPEELAKQNSYFQNDIRKMKGE